MRPGSISFYACIIMIVVTPILFPLFTMSCCLQLTFPYLYYTRCSAYSILLLLYKNAFGIFYLYTLYIHLV